MPDMLIFIPFCISLCIQMPLGLKLLGKARDHQRNLGLIRLLQYLDRSPNLATKERIHCRSTDFAIFKKFPDSIFELRRSGHFVNWVSILTQTEHLFALFRFEDFRRVQEITLFFEWSLVNCLDQWEFAEIAASLFFLLIVVPVAFDTLMRFALDSAPVFLYRKGSRNKIKPISRNNEQNI